MSRNARVTGCLLVVAFSLTSWAGNRTKREELKEFYVAIDAVSDAGPFWFKYVLHAEPIQEGTRVRYIRVAPADELCTDTVTVKAAGAILKETSVWELPGDLNLCSMTEQEVDEAIKPYRYKAATIWDTAAFGIVAKCGPHERLLKLPYTDEVDYDRLTRKVPQIKELYDLVYKVLKRAFGEKSPLHDLTTEQDVAVQEKGSLLLEELRTGRFDGGFWKRSFSMQATLNAYRGTYVPAPREAQLVGTPDQFVKYVPAKYPRMAQLARVEGKVGLSIIISRGSGLVEKAEIVSGHPMLRESASEAARQWVFKPEQEGPFAPRKVTLEFSLQCPKP